MEERGRLDDVVRGLAEKLPEAARTMRADLESNFRAVLQANLGRLDLVSRSEFDVQVKVLERTRALVEQLEQRLASLEARLPSQGS
ncbi:MAG TPA: accessory factor UbiK family protein [Steroidobacteraceae bacterium]|nr:accessory factor UbiK family protein [Steroidobacteraceae bacterium]